ncbi:MAG: homoserine dehydrogenase [Anaerosomatales bacterium]|nr:homoserine dehydrogenase [Anaerosomatales bacterium]MDT8434733.1 homoserine dehydrogenase [Anaerosomatales bacterium]
MRTVNVGLIGLGTVGSGVVEIFGRHAGDFRRRAGVDIRLTRFADRDAGRAEALGLPEKTFTTDAFELISDPELDIVIELIGGTGVARDVVLTALTSGKSVVTANKALMASHGQEVMDTAAEHGVDIAFEASVGGGIPIISPLKHCLVSNEITSIMGIVNGTTNYMLTRMAEDGLDYDSALAEAQDKGFAEADPTADVDGLDAAAKIAILASIAFNSRVVMDQVPAEGIRSISAADVAYAAEMGYAIKLLAIARRTEAGIDIRVHPTMIRMSHPMSGVNGVYNAIYVVGDSVGETMFFGEGAGSLPAASAVVGDVIEVARHISRGCLGLVGCTCNEELPVRDMGDLETSYYLRLRVVDQPGVFGRVATSFGDHGVSLASVIQKGADEPTAEIVYVTHRATERAVRAALAEIEQLDIVESVDSVLRVEDL